MQRLVRRVDDRHRDAVRVLRAADGLVVQEGHDRLAERHALDREQAVPAGVQLVDDDVGVAVQARAPPRDGGPRRCGARRRGPRTRAARGRCPSVVARTARGRRRAAGGRTAATGVDRGEVDARGDHGRLGHPADRVVAADDLGARLLPVGELLGRLPADVRAEVVHHRALAERAQDRELQRLRDERQPEREVEEVGAREKLGERLPLRELAPDEPPFEVERPVGLRVQRVAVEDDELRVDPRRRSAWTFVHGTPAVLTGQWTTRSGLAAHEARAIRVPRARLTPRSRLEDLLGYAPLELVEVAQRGAARADPGAERRELVVRDLAERALDAEVREVEVLLVDDRRDPRVDLDHVLADELDVEEPLDPELADDPVGESPSAPGRRASRSTSRARPASPRGSSGGRARRARRRRSRRSSARRRSRAPSRAGRARPRPAGARPPPRGASRPSRAARAGAGGRGRPSGRGRGSRASPDENTGLKQTGRSG